MSIETKLIIEKNPKTKEYQIKIVLGQFIDKQDALNHASYITITKNIDFSTQELYESLKEIDESYIPINETIH